MAQRVEIEITCDRVAPGHGGEVESLDMTLGGTEYQIDLCVKHRKPYNDLLEMITEDGRRVEPGAAEPGLVALPGGAEGYYKDEAKTAATFRTIDGTRYSVPGDFAEVGEDKIADLVRAVARDGCDVAAVVCTNMRGAGALQRLEAELVGRLKTMRCPKRLAYVD